MKSGEGKHPVKIPDRVFLDTGIFLLHFEDDRRIREIMRDIESGRIEGHTSELNVAELEYKTCEEDGSQVAEIRTRSLRRTPVQIHSPTEESTTLAASLKCRYRNKISLADAYTLATTINTKCWLATTDRILKEIGIVPTTLFDPAG